MLHHHTLAEYLNTQPNINELIIRLAKYETMSREDKLRGLLQEIAKENKYDNCTIDIAPIFSGGANYSSHLYLSTVSAPGKDELHLFAKVAAIGEEARKAVPSAIYTIEHNFYEELFKAYSKIEEKYDIKQEDKLLTAKCYGASKEYLNETLVLENLRKRGFQSFNRFKSVDWSYASFSIKQLALFHALSIVYAKEDVTGYESFMKKELPLSSIKVVAEMMKVNVEKSIKVTKEANKERVARLFSKPDMDNPMLQYLTTSGPVITHGDYRPNNMMHRRLDDGSTEVIVLDYQTLRKGSPVTDLLYFIFASSDKKFRDEYLKKSFELYYHEFSSALRRYNLNPDEIYSKDVYEADIKKLLPCMLSLSFFLLLVITVNEDEAPAITDDIGPLKTNIRPNDLYVERINDWVDNCVKMGVL